jgi:retron-type reverse transcriptase
MNGGKLANVSSSITLIISERLTGSQSKLQWTDVDWKKVEEPVNRLQARIKAKPLRRVYSPKPGSMKKRPLSTATMYDRVMQALYALALSPVAEATADICSFGFMRHRST